VDRPFRGSAAVRDGLLSKDQLRTSAWRRLFRDVYVADGVDVTHALRCGAAALILPPAAVISGYSAACLHGAGLIESSAPVEVTLGRDVRSRAGITVRRSELQASDIVVLNGLRVTSPVRTAFDLARQLDLVGAVVAVDALLTLGCVAIGDVAGYAAGRHSWFGARRVHQVLTLAVPGAESPMETRLRLVPVRELTIRPARPPRWPRRSASATLAGSLGPDWPR